MSTASMPKHYVILGSTSAIAVATARRLATKGHKLTLLARNSSALQEIEDDLRVRGAEIASSHAFDLAQETGQAAILEEIAQTGGPIDGLLVFYGILGDQARAETDPAHARDILQINFNSAVDWILPAAQLMEAREQGVVLTISSVAGDRGRRSNYVYGAAKAGLSVFMQGLAHKWDAMSKELRAVNVKLGFVDTPMTDHLDKGGPLWAKPDGVAVSIERALEKGGPIVYAPWFWRWIMLAIRMTPNFVFKRVNI